jgi:hypothetical protein
MTIKETFEVMRSVSLSNSFGTLDNENDVVLEVNMEYNPETRRGSFEFYRTGTAEWYCAGGLWVSEDNELVDYDGTYALMDFVLDWLQVQGIDVSHMRKVLND